MIVKLKETQIRLDFSFVFVSTAMLLFCDEFLVLISVVSSLLHEFGHLWAMKICGEKVHKIIFGAFGVRIEKYAFSGVSYKKEIAVALGGIFVNFLISISSFLLYVFLKKEILFCISIINFLIAFMNMIPLNMLDMGKALQSFLLMHTSEENARRILQKVSLVCYIMFLLGTVIYSVFIKVNISLVAVALYLCFNFKELK